MTDGGPDPFAHIPEGRLVFPDPHRDPIDLDRRLRALRVTSGWAIACLALALLASVWWSVTFATRGPDDVVVGEPQLLEFFGPTDGNTRWTQDFVMRSHVPFVAAMALCAVPFLWWHLTVDRSARDLGEGLATERWQVRWGWFIPFANLAFPFRSIRELTHAFDSRTAESVVIPWWILWVLPYVSQMLTWNSYPDGGPDYAGDSLSRLESLEKVEVFNGGCYALAATLAIVLVRDLTAAAQERLTAELG